METAKVIDKVRETPQPTTGKQRLLIEKMLPGQYVRQGDIYVLMIDMATLDNFLNSAKAKNDFPGWHNAEEISIANGHVAKSCGKAMLQSLVIIQWWAESVEVGGFSLPSSATFMRATETWEVPHEEHARLVMPPGLYVAWNQTEIDPATGHKTQVLD